MVALVSLLDNFRDGFLFLSCLKVLVLRIYWFSEYVVIDGIGILNKLDGVFGFLISLFFIIDDYTGIMILLVC